MCSRFVERGEIRVKTFPPPPPRQKKSRESVSAIKQAVSTGSSFSDWLLKVNASII